MNLFTVCKTNDVDATIQTLLGSDRGKSVEHILKHAIKANANLYLPRMLNEVQIRSNQLQPVFKTFLQANASCFHPL